jgi:hypothetical protein
VSGIINFSQDSDSGVYYQVELLRMKEDSILKVKYMFVVQDVYLQVFKTRLNPDISYQITVVANRLANWPLFGATFFMLGLQTIIIIVNHSLSHKGSAHTGC